LPEPPQLEATASEVRMAKESVDQEVKRIGAQVAPQVRRAPELAALRGVLET
jgi:hypothetical protein